MKFKFPTTTVLILLSYTSFIFAQSPDPERTDSSKTFNMIEILPEFPGGMENLTKTISNNLNYPSEAIKENISGKVIVGFVIDTLGNATDIKIVQGIREDLNNEAMRVVGLLNGWTPGIQRGKKVKVAYNLPIRFDLSSQSKKKRN